MASELESLLVRLEADTAGLRRALTQADQQIARHETQVRRSLDTASSHYARYAAVVKAHLLAAGTALAAALGANQTRKEIVDTAALSRAAQVAGLTAEEFQRLAATARAAGLSSGSMADSMKELATKVAEVKTRSGGFYEFLRTHLPTVESQIRGTKTTGEAMEVVAETVRRLSTAEERAAFVKQALGDAAIQLVPQLARGAAGLREAAIEAEKFSQIVSEKAVQNITELDRELNELSATLNARFRETLGQSAPALQKGVRQLKEAAAQGWSDFFVDLASKVGQGLTRAIPFVGRATGDMLTSEPVGEAATVAGQKLAVNYLGGFAAAAKQMVDSGTVIKLPEPEKLTMRKKPDYEGADAMRDLRLRVAQANEDAVASLQIEFEADTERYRRLMEDRKITYQQYQTAREQISLATASKIKAAYEKETEEIRKMTDAFKISFENAFGDAFSQLLERGKLDFRAFAGSLIADLARVIAKQMVFAPLANAAGGVLGNLAGNAFGPQTGTGSTWATSTALNPAPAAPGGWATTTLPARASGGPVSAGIPYLVGERGPEVVVPRMGGTVLPNHAVRGGNQVTYNIDASGASPGVEERILRVLASFERQRQPAASQLARARQRFPTR